MALDTEAKRWSMLRASGPIASPIVFNPTGSDADSQDERFTVLRIYGGSLSLSAPVFSGTIPDITGNEGDADIITDLSGYFTDATSYSIAPAVEAGWNFDTVTGILTVDTDEVNTFGTYVVTGTNATGSDDSNAFSVIISSVSTTKGGYVPPIYKKTKLKKKDESIRDEINALLTEVKETTAFVPLKVETGLREVYDKAPEIINLKESTRRTQQLAALSVEVNELRKTLKRTIKEAQEDEETAIQALLEIM